jgi:hypothetical protein
VAGSGDDTYLLAPTAFTHTFVLRTPGIYQITLTSGAQERLSSAFIQTDQPPPELPEPRSALVLGSALLTLAGAFTLKRCGSLN